MLAFVEWLSLPRGGAGGGGGGGKGDGGAPSLRDLLAWTSFTVATVANPSPSPSPSPNTNPNPNPNPNPSPNPNQVAVLGAAAAYVHGACLTFVDGIGLQAASSRAERADRRRLCLERLRALLPASAGGDAAALGVSDDTVPVLT